MSPLLKAVIIGIISSTLIVPFTFTKLYRALELRFFDQRLKLRPLRPIKDSFLVIAIDDKSIKTLGRWPWSRDKHAILIDTLTSLGARNILLDIEFLEASPATLEKEVVANSLREVKERLQYMQSMSNSAKMGQAVPSSPPTSSLLEETSLLEAALDGMLKDYDKELASSIALSNRTYMAFHPVEPLPKDSPLRALYGPLKQILMQEGAEDLAQKLSLNKRQLGELNKQLFSLKNQILLELVEARLKENPDVGLEEVKAGLTWKVIEEELKEAYAKAQLMQYAKGRFGNRPKVIGSPPEGLLRLPVYLEVPIFPLLEACKGIGHVAIIPDEDGVVRSIPLFVQRDGNYFPHLAFQAVGDYLGMEVEKSVFYPGKYLALRSADGQEIKIPVNTSGQTLVNLAGQPGYLGWKDSFPAVSYLLPLELYSTRKDLDLLREGLDHKYTRGSISRLKATLSGITIPEERDRLEGQIAAREAELEAFIKLSIGKTQTLLQGAEGERREQIALTLQEMEDELFVLTKLKEREKHLHDYLKARVEGKMCLVGTFFTGGTDFCPTPYDPASPGLILYCNFINMVLNQSFLKYDEKKHNLPILISVGPIMAVITMAVGSLRGGGALAGLIALYLAMSFLILTYWGLWLHVAGPVLAMITSYTAVTVYRQLTEERMKRQIKHLFQHYLHPTVVNELIKDPRKLRLGGERRELTIHFSDLQGFTPLAESMGPEELEELLNVYLSTVTDIILKHGGTVDKYEGDAIIAFYGAPVEQKDHALRACKAALEASKSLEALNSQFKERGWPTLKARTGLNTGPVVVGNMGTKTRFDYTVIGDSVNLAARLETANKALGTSILMGHGTYERVRDEVFAFYLGLIRVKGKTRAIDVYEPVATTQETSQAEVEIGRLLYQAIKLYQNRQWRLALEPLSRVLELRPNYGPALMYLARCQQYVERPPDPDWEGEIVLEEK